MITKVKALSLIIIARVSLVRLLKNVARVARFQVISIIVNYSQYRIVLLCSVLFYFHSIVSKLEEEDYKEDPNNEY